MLKFKTSYKTINIKKKNQVIFRGARPLNLGQFNSSYINTITTSYF